MNFNPRTPCGVRRDPIIRNLVGAPISIHAPLAGCDKMGIIVLTITDTDFNPRTPCGVRRTEARYPARQRQFQSTHPLRGATRAAQPLLQMLSISIHAPLAGCDFRQRHKTQHVSTISIHAPLAGCDEPLRECGLAHTISIHAPLAGCDHTSSAFSASSRVFQSTHPLRGATINRCTPFCPIIRFQSTHPLRGATGLPTARTPPKIDFNPRTPCGVRHITERKSAVAPRFQSTHPLRGATLC